MQPNFFAEIFISGYVFAAFSAKLSHFSTLSLCVFLLPLPFAQLPFTLSPPSNQYSRKSLEPSKNHFE